MGARFRPLQGRIGLLGDAPEMCRIAECYLGKDVNRFDPAVLAQVQQLLIRQKPNVTTFHDDNGQDLLLAGDVDLVIEYNGDIAQVMREDKDLDFVVPKEGSIMSSDQLCIPAGAPNPEGAHALINYLLDADAAVDIFSTIRYPTPMRRRWPRCRPIIARTPRSSRQRCPRAAISGNIWARTPIAPFPR
jgi:spermidine/putrescine transport system substrate-binding protein